jgi:hypothetical protein
VKSFPQSVQSVVKILSVAYALTLAVLSRARPSNNYFRLPVPALCLCASVVLTFIGCASSGPGSSTNGIPNFAQVEPSIYRGGQPTTTAAAEYLHSIGVSNIIKLNDDTMDTWAPALGMTVHYHPIDTIQQLVTGPDPLSISNAIAEIKPGTFIHCLHGEDRTGLIVGLYRLTEGTNKAAAWQEMTNHGFHPALRGLTEFWDDRSAAFPVRSSSFSLSPGAPLQRPHP